MQLRRSFFPILAQSLVFSWASLASALTLEPLEEPLTQLVSPFMQYSLVGSNYVAEPTTATPLLCGNTSAPASAYAPISPLYYSPTGIGPQKPFVFGASAASPTVPAFATGASIVYGDTMQIIGDPALVCYGLDVNGVHGPTPGVMRDEFEGVNYSPTQKISFNSSVVLNVFHVPTTSTDYYGYTIDVTIPQLPAGYASMCLPPVGTATAPNGIDCNFALIEGFDSSVFDASANLATSGQWCLAPAGAQSCASPAPPGGTSPVFGDININFANYVQTGISLGASIAPAPAKQFHFVAFRKFANNITSLSGVNSPLVITALFSPFDLDENFIGDNVSAGYANAPPAVVQSGDTWTTFSGKLGLLAENTDSGALTFNITDSDTAETGLNLNAAVTLNLAGLQVPVTPNCTLTSSPGATPVNRTCTIDVNFASPTWWDTSVDATYQGQGNLFATDPGGVSASASIVATDSAGKSSTAVTVPIHVQSKVNSAPVVSINAALPLVADSFQAGALIPTYSCSANSCGSRGYVDLLSAISAAPAPAAAFDELATQTTAVVAYAGADANGGNVQCASESGAIFQTNLNPLVLATAVANTYEVNFFLTTTVGSSLCTVTITDAMASFPSGESPMTTARQFRIVVNP